MRTVPEDSGQEIPQLEQTHRVLSASGAARTVANASGPVTIGEGEAIELEFPAPRRIAGVDVCSKAAQSDLPGWLVEAAQDGSWSEIRRVDGPLEPFLTVAGSRVRRTALAGVWVRFAPVSARRLRLVRTAAQPIAVDEVRVFEAPSGQPQPPGEGAAPK